MEREHFKELFSEYLQAEQPFIFVIDYSCNSPVLYKPEEAAALGIFFDFKGKSNGTQYEVQKKINLEHFPISKEVFAQKFNTVLDYLNNGYTYLLNLTFSSKINANLSLMDIFQLSDAPYKLLFQDKFVVFSPECFIKIQGEQIFTYPMKGTIDASIANAANKLLNNKKEEWEHNTIVDLLRNDLAMIAEDITVSRYRFIDHIKTHKGEILQTSSEISGKLPTDWRNHFADNLFKILPAGSITGAPKKKTIEIINECEIDSRGYYTGVFGFFDGKNIDSAVAIRFIENKDKQFYFRSGGGITSNSSLEDEYKELIQKIYIPAPL